MLLHSNHNVLALDTATGGIYIALQVSDGSIKTAYDAGPYGQAEILMPMIDKLIQDCGIHYGDLDAVITTNGPGTFTGLRIGLSTAISLGQSLDIPVHALSCFNAYAAHFYQDQNYSGIISAVVIESKRDDFYIEIFDGQGKALSLAGLYDGGQASQLFKGEDVEIFYGNGASHCADVLEKAGHKGRYALGAGMYHLMNAEALITSQRGSEISDETPTPIYLRGADISMPKNAPRLLKGYQE